MKLSIENVGILSKVDLEINGITVIAGNNDTGKSTISKSLYAMFNGFYRIDEKVIDTKIDNIKSNISNFLEKTFNLHFRKQYIKKDKILKLLENEDNINEDVVRNLLIEIIEDVSKKSNLMNKLLSENTNNLEIFHTIGINDLVKKINDTQLMNETITNRLIEKSFNREFSGQINNINTNETSNIILTIQDMDINIEIKEEKLKFKKSENIGKIYTRTEYIDDPLILDKINEKDLSFINHFNGDNYFHSDNLIYDLQKKSGLGVIEEIQIDEKIENIFSKINKKGIGKLRFEEDLFSLTVMYEPSKESKGLDIRNVSAGLKSFLIIKTLFEKGVLEEKGVLILDEPEVHLHPEWQVLFAELIVLIQKEFNMHILLTTHSPYFLYAVELYSKKYKINKRCKFYFSEKKDEKAILSDVTDDTGIIFKSLSTPFFKLEDMEVKMEEENCEK